MRFNERWLREWVSPKLTTKALAEQLTMAGLEVDAIEPVAPLLDSVVVGRVKTVTPHPNADRLRVCEVDVGEAKTLNIVCGASNVVVGLRVPTAKLGARLSGGLTIKKAKLRGVESQGMLCSAAEIGLAESAQGLFELPEDAVPGAAIYDYLQLDDVSIELGLTPNRGDCLSIAGIAREVAAITGTPLSAPTIESQAPVIDDVFAVTLSAPEACPRYVGRVIRNVKSEVTTPLWLQEKLRRCGLRSIHPVVDVTNVVLLELGQPMHAFDLAKLDGGIEVRYGRKGETLSLLDGQDVTVDEQTLVIADHSQALALAGIMGGAASAVGDTTSDLFLEAAFFTPNALAGRARCYGLHTDSSQRFERGVDPDLPQRAMERATALLLEIVGGKPGPIINATVSERLPKHPTINLRPSRIKRILGHDIEDEHVTAILTRLSMDVVKKTSSWQVTPPSFRFDVTIEADLIEEVARVYGYSQLPNTQLKGELALSHRSQDKVDLAKLKRLLVARGYQEAITYSFVDAEAQSCLFPTVPTIKLTNPIAADMSVMRVSLWPGLLNALRYNLNRQQSRVRLFEVGTAFTLNNGKREECAVVAGVLCGDVFPEQWGKHTQKMDYFDIKSDVEAILGLARCDEDVIFKSDTIDALHPGQSASLATADGKPQGWLGRLHPSLQKTFDFVEPVFLFELQLDEILQAQQSQFQSWSKFPSIRRDIAIVVDKNVSASQVTSCVVSSAGEKLQSFHVFDVYEGKGVDSGRKSLALGLTLQDTVGTLKDEDVDLIINKVLDVLNRKLDATLRE